MPLARPAAAAGAPSDPWLAETSADATPALTDSWLKELATSAPPPAAPEPHTVPEPAALPAPEEARAFNGAAADAPVETGVRLGELMRRLDSFYSGLVQMERRLDTSAESYVQVTDRWCPVTPDPEPRKAAPSPVASAR